MFCGDDSALTLRKQVHSGGEEERLDQRVFLKRPLRDWRLHEKPGGILRVVSVRQALRLRDEVEVVVLVDEVFRDVPLWLEEARRPVAVDQLPVSVEVDPVPAVVDGATREGDTWTVVNPLRPPADGKTGKTRVAKQKENRHN